MQLVSKYLLKVNSKNSRTIEDALSFLLLSICFHKVPEGYIELSQTATLERFCKMSQRLKAVNYFRKKAPS